MKVASFTVRATMAQSIRWKQAAAGEGHASAGTWLAYAADAYLKVRARAGLPIPLAWRRFGTFSVLLMDGSTAQVRGAVSPPFGIFQGSALGPNGNKGRALVHLPTRRIIATLKSSAQCRALAAELAPLLIRDEHGAVSAVVDRHVSEQA